MDAVELLANDETIGLFVRDEGTPQYRLYCLTGDLDAATVSEARKAFSPAFAATEDTRPILIDLRDLDYVDTSGLAFLLTVVKAARPPLQQYSLSAASVPALPSIAFVSLPGSQPFRMLDMCGINRFTEIIPSLDEAIARFG
jgi:ABC-type transporter Mla MlaB component